MAPPKVSFLFSICLHLEILSIWICHIWTLKGYSFSLFSFSFRGHFCIFWYWVLTVERPVRSQRGSKASEARTFSAVWERDGSSREPSWQVALAFDERLNVPLKMTVCHDIQFLQSEILHYNNNVSSFPESSCFSALFGWAIYVLLCNGWVSNQLFFLSSEKPDYSYCST